MDKLDFPFSSKALRTEEQPISFLMAMAVTNPDLISLAAGLVDYASLPTEETRQLLTEILSDRQSGQIALQYGTTHGLLELRQALLAHLSKLEGRSPHEMNLSVDNCIVTTGSQQGLYILSDILLNPGDLVITCAPSYFVYTGTLASFGADVRTVPIDQNGMRTDLLAEMLARLQRDGQIERLKIIYVVSYYQNPSGISLAAERRKELAELVRKYSRRHRILIIEDSAYRELRYDGPVLPSIKSFDPNNEYVALAMTFSKPFSAGMKTGYLFVPDQLVDPILQQKGNHDFGSNNLVQHLIHRSLIGGTYHAHVEKVRQAYRPKRDTMLDALSEHFKPLGSDVQWTRPAGGLYVWLTLPKGFDTRRGGQLFERCVSKGMLYVPGDYCFATQKDRPTPTNHMRLSFGVVDITNIREGIRRLAEAVLEQAHTQPAARPAGLARPS